MPTSNAVQQVLDKSMTQSVQGGVTAGSLLATVAAWLDAIHGPAATIGAILGAFWLGLQIYLAVEKRWFRKNHKDK